MMLTMKMTFAPLALLVLVAACNGSATKDLGCLTDLGSAETSFNAAADGLKNGTTTSADDAKSMGDVRDKLKDLAVVNDVPEIKAKATDGSTLAGQVRVEISGGSTFGASSEVAPLRADINALDAACTKAGK